jgi:dynein heavy chain
MSEIIGFDITPDMGTSLRKVLKYDLSSHMEEFEAISAGASKVTGCSFYVPISGLVSML